MSKIKTTQYPEIYKAICSGDRVKTADLYKLHYKDILSYPSLPVCPDEEKNVENIFHNNSELAKIIEPKTYYLSDFNYLNDHEIQCVLGNSPLLALAIVYKRFPDLLNIINKNISKNRYCEIIKKTENNYVVFVLIYFEF